MAIHLAEPEHSSPDECSGVHNGRHPYRQKQLWALPGFFGNGYFPQLSAATGTMARIAGMVLVMFFVLVSHPLADNAVDETPLTPEARPGANDNSMTDTQAQTEQPDKAEQKDAAEAVRQAEPESSEPEQADYPGIAKKHLELGGYGEPRISIYYPEVGNEKLDAALKLFAENQAGIYSNEVKESLDPNGEKPSFYDMWELNGFYTVEKPNPNLVSITFNIYAYSGGAHGNLTIYCLNFDLRSGSQVGFVNLFRDPEKALTLLSKISAEKLRKDLGQEAEDDMIQDGTTPQLSNFDCLTLTPKGVMVNFQPYQVGPWAIGPQRVAISLEELASAGPEPAIWPDFQSGQEKAGQTQ